jgi:hypothetical protein
MTNEEAIEVLKNDIEICTIQQKQACDMAIKALEELQELRQEHTCEGCRYSSYGFSDHPCSVCRRGYYPRHSMTDYYEMEGSNSE